MAEADPRDALIAELVVGLLPVVRGRRASGLSFERQWALPKGLYL